MNSKLKKTEVGPKGLFQRVIGGTLNYGMGSMIPRIVSFFLIPLYTKYLNPSDYGIVELCGSLGLFIMTLMRVGVPGSVSRFYFDHKDNEKELRDYVTTVHRFLAFASVSIGLIIGVVFYFFAETITPGLLFFPFIVIVLINSAFSSNSDLQRRLLQSSEQSRYTVILNIFNAFFGIFWAIVFVVGFELGALGILYSQLITTFIFFIQAQLFLRKYRRGTFKRSMLKTSLIYGANTLPHLLFGLLAPFLSKLILVHSGSMAALGIFSLATRFVQPLQIATTAFNQSYTPIYYSLRKEGAGQERLGIYMRLVWICAAIACLGILFILPPLIPMITPARFHASADLVPVLASGSLWQIIYFLTVIDLFYTKRNKYVGLISLGGLLTNILVTVILVGPYGSEALAWAQFCGFFAWAFLAKLLVDKYGEVKLQKGMIWQTILLNVISIGLIKFVFTNEMLLYRSIAFTIISLLIIYIFIIKHKATYELIRNLKIFRKKSKLAS